MLRHEAHLDFVMAYQRLFGEMAPNSDICTNTKKLERMVRMASRDCAPSFFSHLSTLSTVSDCSLKGANGTESQAFLNVE
mmetsp:Transcript_21982/g.58196  ORF Transcript_21982/g.58196 Transcript_21982/m.58196 type:complete len:80 (+) Transcript_21982:1-240(+)